MPLFNICAKKGPKEIIEQFIEADTQDEAVARLIQEGYFPIRVKQVSELKETALTAGGLFSRVKIRDINIFTRQMASLIKSGVPLLRAINIIVDQTENPSFKTILIDIGRQVKEGQQFSAAMSRYPRIFPLLYTAMVKAGEDSGTLEQVLIRLTDHRERTEEIKSKIRTALAYPILALCVGLGTIAVLVFVVIPQLKKVFDNIGQTLPLPTRILLGLSDFVITYWYLILGAIVLVLIISKGVTIMEKKALDTFKLQLPFLGRFIKKSEMNNFSRTLSLLLTNGIPILRALEITIPTLANEVIKQELKRVSEGLKSGDALAHGLKETPYFFPYMVNMIAVGEESGRLDETLAEVASTYERELTESIKIFLSLLEPCIILIMGVLVGFIVMSMLLPIFQIDVTAH